MSFTVEDIYLMKTRKTRRLGHFMIGLSQISRGRAHLKIDGEIDVGATGNDLGAGSGGSIKLDRVVLYLGEGSSKQMEATACIVEAVDESVSIAIVQEDTLEKFAYGGVSSGDPKRPGGAGTIYVNYTDFPNHLFIANNGFKRNYRGFTDVMIADNRGFVSPQVHDDGIGKGTMHGSKAGYVPNFFLDEEVADLASELRRDFSSRIPTTLIFVSEDESIDWYIQSNNISYLRSGRWSTCCFDRQSCKS